jgi:hypothetical protein
LAFGNSQDLDKLEHQAIDFDHLQNIFIDGRNISKKKQLENGEIGSKMELSSIEVNGDAGAANMETGRRARNKESILNNKLILIKIY